MKNETDEFGVGLVVDKWKDIARRDQLPPDEDWMIWILLGGRGAGKTRAGAEWVRQRVIDGAKRIALVGPTYNEAREVMILGESGLLNIGPEDERPKYFSSRHRLEWPNGAIGQVFSSEDPDGLRGPQFDCAWADEFCAWTYPDDTLSNLRLGLRIGDAPQLVITTTPKPIKALKNLIDAPGVAFTKATTMDNEQNLSPAFISSIYEIYGGTRLGRQELNGEIIEDIEGALWSRAVIDQALVKDIPPEFERIVVAVDPAVTSGERADSCGLVVAGRVGSGKDAIVYILQDATIQGLTPQNWAKLSVSLCEKWGAAYIVIERNQGGDMIRSVFNVIEATVLIKTVFANKSKIARAAPVSAYYEKGRVKHVGSFPELEDELCALGAPDSGSKSPDRADALVWAVTELLPNQAPEPKVTVL